MKKVFVLAALLVAASACAPAENVNTASPNANAAATPAATATPAQVTQADIEAKERQLWDAIKAKNWDAFGALLSDDFTFVRAEGIYDKAKSIESLKKFELTEYTFSDVKFVKVDEDNAVLVYNSTEKSTYDGKPTPDKSLRNASAWLNRGGKWVNVYHQESYAESMPMPSPSASPSANKGANSNANASASPSASPAPATATDAEKAVWEAIKRRDGDAFSAFISSSAIEVEPEGVYDREGSAKAITMFDASKSTLSDFKETKLDADTTLLTYMVEGPGPGGKKEQMRHSTIWNNRGGRWQAFFHMGTIVTHGM